MKLIELVRTASCEANALAAGAATLLVVKILLLNRVPSLFLGFYDLGVIIEAILASVVASYVFYLLVVHVKEQSDREVLRPYVEKHTKRIIGECKAQINEISRTSLIPIDLDTLAEADLRSALSRIPPHSDAPLLISAHSNQHANWFQFFVHHQDRSRSSIRKLLDQLPFLDATHVQILTEVDDCSHFAGLIYLRDAKVSNSDLTVWAKPFYEYCQLCKKLNSHMVRLGFSSALQ